MSGRGALALTVASIGGGVLNYLFLVHGATALDAAAFGDLSAWLARVTAVGVVATVVQFMSLDFRLGERAFTSFLRLAGVVSVALAASQLALGTRAPVVLLGVSAVVGGSVLYAFLGQLQVRLRLGAMAVSVMGASALRFALPFAWPRDGRAPAFYVAHATSAYAGLAVAALFVALLPGSKVDAPPSMTPPKPMRVRLARPILLAFATSVFPLIDVLVVSATQDAATTGAFSRIGLAARVVFFGGAAALQILLPHQLHAAATGDPVPPFVARMERLLTLVMVGGAAVLASGIDQVVLHPRGQERIWLYATCLSAGLLVAILDAVNRLAARARLGLAAACVGGVVLVNALSAALALVSHEPPVTRFALGALAGDALVLVLARAAQMRSRPSGSLR